MNDTFERTWGDRGGPRPAEDYWPTVIPAVKSDHPDFLFIAEAYWDLEWALQQQGFDYCYDKRLYDRLVHEGAEQVQRAPARRDRLPAAARALPREPRRAARRGDVPAARKRAQRPWRRSARPEPGSSTTASSRAGRCSCPCSSARRPDEPADAELAAFYDTAAAPHSATASSATGTGSWASGPAGRATTRRRTWSSWGWHGEQPVARRRQPERRLRPPATSRSRGTTCAAHDWRLVDATDGERLRAQRRRPLRRPLRRARPVGLASVRPDPASRTLWRTDRWPKSDDSRRRPSTARLAEATGRAEDDLFTANPWYEWGPYLSERAWGTVREDYSASGDAWELLPPRSRPVARVPLERGRHGRDLRHPPRAVPGPRALERRRPDPEGADVRPDRAAGQPRRGRQGVLVVPRGAAEPRPAALALPLPAGRVPVRGARQPRPRAARPRVRAARHRRVRRRPLLVGRGHLREGLADRDPGADRPSRTTGRTRRRSTCCRRCGSATRGVGRPTTDRPRIELDGDAVAVADHALGGYRLEASARARRRRTRALFCENETNAARVFGSDPTTPYPKDGINDHVVSGAATVNPDQSGTKAAWRYHVTVPAGGKAELRLRLHRPADAERKAGLGGHSVRRRRRRARSRRGRVLRGDRAGGDDAERDARSSARPAPG